MSTLRTLGAAFLLAASLFAQDKPAAAAKSPFLVKPALNPMTTCVVSEEALDDTAVSATIEGRTFKTCCDKCMAKVKADPAKFAAKLDAAIQKQQDMHYPLAVCAVSGEKLGSMGEPVPLMLDGMLVKLCCKKCVDKATKNAAAMAQKVRMASFELQQKHYPLDTCLVGGEKLGDAPVSAMFGNTLVKFCCEKCVAKFEASPDGYVKTLHAAYEKAHEKGDKKTGEGHGEHGKEHKHGEHAEQGRGGR